MAGIIEIECSPFLTCVARDEELNPFKSSSVLLLTVLSLEINSIANSFYKLFLLENFM